MDKEKKKGDVKNTQVRGTKVEKLGRRKGRRKARTTTIK